MGARTGLEPLEEAVLDAVDLLSGSQPFVRCTDVLAVVESRDGIGRRYAWPAIVDLSASWRVHLPLLESPGTIGSFLGDPPGDPAYVETRLSEVGVLALASSRGEVGPVPLGIVEGTLYRDGRVPPFSPAKVVGALLAGEGGCGPPELPTGGSVTGDIDALMAGDEAVLTLGCTFRAAGGDLLITAVPLGVAVSEVLAAVEQRARRDGSPVVDAQDESSGRHGIQVRVMLQRGADLRSAVQWLRGIRPVTVEVACRLPAPQSERLRDWDRGDGSGLRALADLLAPRLRS